MNGEGVIQNYLRAKLEEIQVKNPSYSLRRFSQRVGLSPATLSAVLLGKRKLSRDRAISVAERLELNPQQMQEIENIYGSGGVKEEAHTARNYTHLSLDQYHVVSEWYHFAILSLIKTEKFVSDSDWIAQRLRLTPSQAHQAVERMLRLEMLVRDKKGRLRTTGVQYSTPDGIRSTVIRKGHAKNLELAQQSLERDDIDIRDFSALTLTFNPADMPEARKMLREFVDRFAEKFSNRRKREVYKVCMQLFPLSQPFFKKGKV